MMHQQPTSSPAAPDYPATPPVLPDEGSIIVPRLHGQVLIEPPASRLFQAIEMPPGRYSFSRHSDILGIPEFGRLADIARQDLYQAVCTHAAATGMPAPAMEIIHRPWIVTGHQSEFYHAGVWAKVLAADILARQAGAQAFDLIVDHDLLNECGFALPVPDSENAGQWRKDPVDWGKPEAVPSQFIDAPRHRRKQEWIHAVKQSASRGPVGISGPLLEFLDEMSADDGAEFVPWLSRARAGFERAMGLEVWHAPCSLLCAGDAWIIFVLSWIARARSWAAVYNAALADYRLANDIASPGQPMPDLLSGADQVEMPFWIFGVNQPRSRLILDTASGAVFAAGKSIPLQPLLAGTLSQRLTYFRQQFDAAGLFVRPRALTLTIFARGFLADLFIHGIGGALYDRITDRIMSQLFGTPPPYACISAGWLLPFPEHAESPLPPSTIRGLRHHLWHNPDFSAALADPTLSDAALRELRQLAAERRRIIQTLADSPVHDRTSTIAGARAAGRRRRTILFRRLHDIIRRCHQLYPAPLSKLDAALAGAEIALRQRQVTEWREYFFAIHPRDSLVNLHNALRQRLGRQ